jgi:hypothetical protein
MLKDFYIGEVGEKCSKPEAQSTVCHGKPIANCCSKPAGSWYKSIFEFLLIKILFSNWPIFAGVAIFGAAVAYKLLSRS